MKNKLFLLLGICSILLMGCDEEFTPKPRGFFRINLPEKKYKAFNPESCPYSFQIPVYAEAVSDSGRTEQERCWYNIEFPYFKGTVYLSYRNFQSKEELQKLSSDSREMVMKHISKASGLDEDNYNDASKSVYATVYTLKGSTASQMQFYATDSAKNFLRGSLYFYAVPQPDSIAPVNHFVQQDILQMIATLQWK